MTRAVVGFYVYTVLWFQAVEAFQLIPLYAPRNYVHLSTSFSSTTSADIDGLMGQVDFDRLDAVDKTIRALCVQLPKLLTHPLTASSTEQVYEKECFSLSIQVDEIGENSSGQDTKTDGFVVLKGQKDLLALSNVLVLATAAVKQVNSAITGGAAVDAFNVQCQIIVDDTYRTIRIPWKANAPLLGSPNSNNLFEGITDIYLSEDAKSLGKVERFVIRSLSLNGRELNGPAIGNALKSVQTTVTNLEQSPLFPNLLGSSENQDRTSSFLASVRDAFLDQAVNAFSIQSTSSFRSQEDKSNDRGKVQVHRVSSIQEIGTWIEDTDSLPLEETSSLNAPCPGTDEWCMYKESRSHITNFYQEVIPQLSNLSIVNPNLFTEDATYKASDGSILLSGRDQLANYFQSLALTRKATSSTWTMTKCKVVSWRKNQISVDYEATSSGLSQWRIKGTDVYQLVSIPSTNERPVISEIRQQAIAAVNQVGSEISLDSQWVFKNLANALDRDGSGKAARDFITELLMQQPGTLKTSPEIPMVRKKLTQSAAALFYNIMVDLHDHTIALLTVSSSQVSPPASEYMDDNIELRGYLGESILKGKTLYNRSIGSVIFSVRDSIRRNRILVEKIAPPRVELLIASDSILLTTSFTVRVPNPGAGVILPESVSSPPFKIEIVSDYKINPATGTITEHRLVETRVNGRLTPGDQISRWVQPFLNAGDTVTATNEENMENDSVMKAIGDTLAFFRSISSKVKE